MSEYFAKRQERDALNAQNGPNVADIHSTLIGLSVLVFRPKKDKLKTPFPLSDINEEDVMVSTEKVW